MTRKVSSSINIGTLFRTRIRIHYSWLLVFVLIPWTVSTQFSPETDLSTRVILGIAAAGLFLGAVLLREAVLLIIAGSRNVRVKTVTIFAFGGLIQTEEDSYTPSLEMLLTVSGMLSNFAITLIFYLIHLIFGSEEHLLLDMPFKWLAFFYLTLSLFHLLPIYPLEGGRLFHSLFWRIIQSERKATFMSSVSGWILGFAVMVGAIILTMFTTERFTGLFFIGLGLIIQNAATHGFRFARLMPVPIPYETVPAASEPLMEMTAGDIPPEIENTELAESEDLRNNAAGESDISDDSEEEGAGEDETPGIDTQEKNESTEG
jgi:Zn-dependent protease